jgi:valyl-tRNA synthetase
LATNQKAKFALRAGNNDSAGEKATIARLLNASELIIDSKFQGPPGIPVAMTRSGELFLLVDVDPKVERERLDKELAKVEADLRATEAKLANKSFVDRAPAAVVEEHRQRQKKFADQLAKLKQARDQL